MPRNIVIASTAIISIVAAAFFDSGGLKAGTPFETASTPVMAVHPFENAVSSRNSASGSCVDGTGSTGASGCTVPVSTRPMPMAISARVQTMKKYVGTEKI